jgi:hypothetical protein
MALHDAGRVRPNKIRNPNFEIRNNVKCQKSECLKRTGKLQYSPAIGAQLEERVSRIRISSIELASSFLFRASDLKAHRAPGSCKAI